MYVPKHFAETRVDVMHSLIREHPLGTLVTMTSRGLEANHVPFEVIEGGAHGTLRCHVARANPMWREFSPDIEAIATFCGAHAYVSPSWYATKQESGKVVPTWNYVVVHARGPLIVIEDREWLRAFVTRLTHRNESHRANPWQVTDAPPEFIDQMLDNIVGIELPVTSLTGKWKVSQNRPARDRESAAEGLSREGHESATAMARLVRGKPAD
ncbi:MAG TPA: FMN-binding negative transcriptional regulator [Casimicrobiaceae bacterium]|nr:FMN-binding negative transcriptional regulator [Casimicrobiaceae bacterium]